MAGLSYSIFANNSIQQYRLAAVGQYARNSLYNTTSTNNNRVSSRQNYFNPIDTVEISDTIGQLSSKAYTELRGQQMTVNTVKATDKPTEQLDKGYWGSAQTASRILETAKGLSSGDSERLSIIIDAVKKGFEDAQFAARGELPEVSLNTQQKVFAELDSWAESLNR